MSTESAQSLQQDAVLRASIDRSLRHPVMFFFTSGAAWLAVSIIFGLISAIKVHSPGFMDSCGWSTYGRVFAAHNGALIYGWGCQAAFGALIWLVSRLSRQPAKNAGTILAAGHVWNFAISIGTLFILGGAGTGIPWMEYPKFVWPVLFLCYTVIAVWSLIQFRIRSEGAFVSQWFFIGAMLWFPWILLTAFAVLFCLPGHPIAAAAVNAWYRSALTFLFFAPVGIGAAYYLVPKVTGRPLFSHSLAVFSFWSLAVIAPWAGLQKLTGVPISGHFLPYLGAAATILLAIPAFAAAFNAFKTAKANEEMMANSPTLRFALGGILSLGALGFAALLLNLPNSTLRLTQFSLSQYGFDILAIYAFFSFVMFGAIYFIVPRITRREWLSRGLIKMHFLFSLYGIIAVVALTILGGIQQGIGQEDWAQPWFNAVKFTYPYAWGTTIAWFFILVSNSFFFLHLALMWLRLGRRSNHPTLLGGDHHESPHGPEGDIDNCGPSSAASH